MDSKIRKTINISLQGANLWVTLILTVLLIGGIVFGGLFYAKDKFDQVETNKLSLENHEVRIKNVEDTVNDVDEALKSISELKEALNEFKTELSDTRKEWTKLYRDFDLKKK